MALSAKLPALGEVLTVSRNAHVVLAEYGPYPTLRPRADGLAAADDDSRVFADFTRWGTATAREESLPGDHGGNDDDDDAEDGDGAAARVSLCSLTFHDPAGNAFHRVCLLPGSDPARFRALVRGHPHGKVAVRGEDDCPHLRHHHRPAGPAGGEIVAMRRSRLPALLARAAGTGWCGCGRPGCIDAVRPLKLPPAQLPAILGRAAESALSLRVSVFQDAIVHSARFTPSAPPMDDRGEWACVHDARASLHLRLAGVAALWFTLPTTAVGEDDDGGGEETAAAACLEAYDARGELLAAFVAADPTGDEALWRSLVCFG